MKKNKIGFILIILLAIFVRIIGIDKSEGLWFDEGASWIFSTQDFPFGIINTVLTRDFNPPLYYLLLGLWVKILGTSDITFRLFSATAGVLTVIPAYLVAGELNLKRKHFFAILAVIFNSMLIHFSMEVRPYALLVFFMMFFLVYLLRFLNSKITLKNSAGLIITSLACCFTASLGTLFVAGGLLPVFGYLAIKKDKEQFIPFFKSCLIIGFIYLPYFLFSLKQASMVYGGFINGFDWTVFRPISVFYSVIDGVSPLLSNIYNNDYGYLARFFKNSPAGFILFIMMPLLIYVGGFISAVVAKNKKILILLSLMLFALLIEIIFSANGKLCFIDRYTLIWIVPFLIISVYGLCSIKSNYLFRLLAVTILSINFLGLFVSSFSIIKTKSAMGYKLVADVINNQNSNNPSVIFLSGAEVFEKYNTNNYHLVDFDVFKGYYLNERKTLEKIIPAKFVPNINFNNKKELLRDYLKSPIPNQNLKEFLQKDLISTKKQGERVYFVADDGLMPSRAALIKIVDTPVFYDEAPFIMLIATKNYNDIFNILISNLNYKGTQKSGIWVIHTFEKNIESYK